MSWSRLDGRCRRLFGRDLRGKRYGAASVGSDLTGLTAVCLVGSWEGGEISCWVSWFRLDGTDGRLFGRELGAGKISCGELCQN